MNALTNSQEIEMTYFTAPEQKRDKTRLIKQVMMQQLLTGKRRVKLPESEVAHA